MHALVTWCLARRSVVLLATVLVLLGGIVGATQLRQQLFPDFDFPFSIGTMAAPGVDAATLDEQVAKPVERAVATIEGVEGVTTVASDGQLRLYTELAYGSDSKELERLVTERIAKLDLPDIVEDPEFAGGFQEQAVVLATLSATDGDLAGLTRDAAEIQADLESVDGVARVDVGGGSDPQVSVTLEPSALERGITAQAVADAIESSRTRTNAGIVPGPGGAPVGLVVEGADLGSAGELGQLRVGGTQLADVATIVESDAADGGYASVNGDPALTISVFRETGKDEVTAVDGTIDVLDTAEKRLDGNAVSVLYESASDIRSSIMGLIIEGSLGALFAVIVIFLFLRSVRGTLVAAISIPTSIVFGILAAWMLGLTINIITLAGLTIAVGRVIDDGIVVLENIHKHLERGATRHRAMIDGTSEVAVAIASSTIATAAVFLPIGLVGGLISEIFLSFSIIVTAALLASLLVAVTLIPVVGSYVLRPSGRPHDPNEDTLARAVIPATKFGIRWRWPVLIVAILSMVAVFGAVGAGAIPVQFLPSEGASQVIGTAQLPPGTSVEQARRLLAPLDEEIAKVDGLKDVQLTYGIPSGNAAFDPTIGSSTAEFFFTLEDGADGEAAERKLRTFGLKEYDDGFSVMVLTDGPPSGTFQVNLEGDDQASIATAATQVDELLHKRANGWDLVEIEAQAAQEVPQLLVRAKADAPVSADAVQAALRGVTTPITVDEDGVLPVVVSGGGTRVSGDPKQLGKLPVATGDGSTLPLARVATFEQASSPLFVNRVEGRLSGSITARMLGEDTAGTTKDIRAAVEKLDLPKGVTLDWEQGDAAFVNEMFKDMMIAMLVAITLVFFVLVVFFGSLAHPFTILAPILFSFIGSFGALIVTQRALGLPAMIGQLLLIGIIVSNSILLVDAALKLRRQGVPRDEALIQAARLRVRPVLMTAAATIAALTPLALGISGEGGIISQSLGTVVIGGLLVATLLTLVIVPAVFRLLDRDRDMTDLTDDPREELPTEPRPLAGSTSA
ncbi:MAG: hydrogenase expression protein [Thermoleophilia bacterium]|nr:hydrogenase expression protein [Thermoleophilia bacterium]